MFKTYITHSKAGHYTVTIKDEKQCTVFKRQYVDNIDAARWLVREMIAMLEERARQCQPDSQYGKLSEASYKIEDWRVRSEVQEVLCEAADNATDTMQEVLDRSWESVFRSTLEGILCCGGVGEAAREWFRGQGVKW